MGHHRLPSLSSAEVDQRLEKAKKTLEQLMQEDEEVCKSAKRWRKLKRNNSKLRKATTEAPPIVKKRNNKKKESRRAAVEMEAHRVSKGSKAAAAFQVMKSRRRG